MVILNDNAPTLQPVNQNPSIIALTIVSNNIAEAWRWWKIQDVGASDHHPTICVHNISSKSKGGRKL